MVPCLNVPLIPCFKVPTRETIYLLPLISAAGGYAACDQYMVAWFQAMLLSCASLPASNV
jgi:hypothetical protein